jgi:ABC-type nitrate/sulfonate/bicarbonate transport system substrate-binding protein
MQGAVDAVTLTPPQTFAVASEGMVQIVDFDKEVAPYESGISIVRRSSVTVDRDTLLAYGKGMYEGLIFTKTHKDLALQAAAKYSGITDSDVLSKTYDHTLPRINDRPTHSVEGVRHIISILSGLPKDQYDIPFDANTAAEDFFTDQIAKELDESGYYNQIDRQYGYISQS